MCGSNRTALHNKSQYIFADSYYIQKTNIFLVSVITTIKNTNKLSTITGFLLLFKEKLLFKSKVNSQIL